MASIVTIEMMISGDEGILQDCLSFMGTEGTVISLHRVMPMPEILFKARKCTLSDVGYLAWYGPDEEVNQYLSSLGRPGLTDRPSLCEHLESQDSRYRVYADAAFAAENMTGFRSWLDWCAENWQSKRDVVSSELVSREPGKAVVRFQTEWSVPEKVLVALSGKYPSLEVAGHFSMELECVGRFERSPEGLLFHYEPIEC